MFSDNYLYYQHWDPVSYQCRWHFYHSLLEMYYSTIYPKSNGIHFRNYSVFRPPLLLQRLCLATALVGAAFEKRKSNKHMFLCSIEKSLWNWKVTCTENECLKFYCIASNMSSEDTISQTTGMLESQAHWIINLTANYVCVVADDAEAATVYTLMSMCEFIEKCFHV